MTLNYNLPQLLKALAQQGGSDVHICAESPPRMRIDGDLFPFDLPVLTPEDTKNLCFGVMNEDQRKIFADRKEVDFSFAIKDLARFRANVFNQKGAVSGSFRLIPFKINSLEDLGMPRVLTELASLPRGIVLVTGPTGSGKSTTLSAMVDYINHKYAKHIVTIEDPIEFVHSHGKCLINQREVGTDTNSFSYALRSALRQDPDVVLVGEMRDYETISLALTTAETGHLVFATLHTNSTTASLNRMIDVFPPAQQNQIRTQLSFSVMGIVSQLLLPNINNGRSMAMEILRPNIGIRNMIRENKVAGIYGVMQSGQAESHMITMNQSLANLVLRRQISIDTGMNASSHPDELKDMLIAAGFKVS